MTFTQTIKDIKDLKIQGAQNVAKEAVKALAELIETKGSKIKDVEKLRDLIQKSKNDLINSRVTEPGMRNALAFTCAEIYNTKNEDDSEISVEDIIYSISIRATEALAQMQNFEDMISKFGAEKIKDGMVIHTHCHSHSVINILKKAWDEGKHFEVHCTETRPLFQGRQTATDLAKHGIPVTLFVDSAVRFSLKDADLVLVGADAITSDGKIINKVGSELIAEAAKAYSVPVYSCTNSWKYDPKTAFGFDEQIEKRFASEVWDKPPKGVKVSNFAFEQMSPELISGVISEFGIFKPELIATKVEKEYPWMFK